MLDWEITAVLEGKWSAQTIQDLNTAMNDWWCADFFSEITFSAPGQTVSATGDSDRFSFDELVDFSANGDDKDSLEKRNGFDPAVHQRLLDSMKIGKSSIKFSVDEEYEGEPGEWYTINYKVTSDGKRFVVEKDFDVGDFLVTGKLCGDWSEDTIKMLNELMDFLDENEDAREGYRVRGIHFSASEKESAPVEMGEIAPWLGENLDILWRTQLVIQVYPMICRSIKHCWTK